MILTLIGWLIWLIVGALVGLLASRFLRNSHKLLTPVLLGILGAFLGGFLFSQFGIMGITDISPWSILAALVGAVLLLALMGWLGRHRIKTITPVGASIPEQLLDAETRRGAASEALRIGRVRIPLLAVIALIVLLPVLDVALWMLRLPDLTARPPLFGTVSTYQNEAGQLDYLVYAPPSYQQGTDTPLLVFLHGCTQDPYILEAASGMRNVADQEGFLIVYPQQNAISSPHRCWNWYDTRNQQRDSGEPSLLLGIVNQVQQDYSVDARRIYVSGISSGGAMTSILASCYPDVFAAAAVHSGMAYKASVNVIQAITAPLSGSQVPPEVAGRDAYACSGETQRPIPTIVLHGTTDSIVVVANSQDTVEQVAQLNDFADDGTDNATVEAQPTNSERGQVEGGYAYTIEDYQYNGERLMQRYVVDGLWHMWSGGTGTYPLSDPKAPDASQIFWDFLSAYQLS